MNTLFPQETKDFPSLWTQFYIETIRKVAVLKTDLLLFLRIYKNEDINEEQMRYLCKELEHIFWFWIDVDLALDIIIRMENQFKDSSEHDIDAAIKWTSRIFSSKLRQIKTLITPTLLSKDVFELWAKNVDIHINTIRLLWLTNKKKTFQKETK